MNSPSDDFKDILVSSSSATGLVFQTDIFVGFEPEHDLTTSIVTLYDTGGDRPQVNFVYNVVRVQARIRGAKFGYQVAYTMSETVRNALHELTHQTVNGTKYIAIWAISDIFSLGQDEKARPIFTVNFEAHRTA